MPTATVPPTKSRSKHFDGKRFRNPTLPGVRPPGMRSILRMLRTPHAKWPRHVANPGTPQLDLPLGRDDVAVTFVGHATFLLQFPGFNVLTDPVWAGRAGPFGLFGPRRHRDPAIAWDDLPQIDVILLTHNHYDHLDVATLRRLARRFGSKIIVPLGNAEHMARLGFEHITELDWWDQAQPRANLRVTLCPTQHFTARTLWDRQRTLWGAYMLHTHGHRIYFGGDAAWSVHFVDTRLRLGEPDLAFLGIGAYEPRWFMQPMHMDPTEAVRAHLELGSQCTISMHHGTFQLSAEAMDQPVADLRTAVDEAGVHPEKFITLPEGETRKIAL